MHYKIVNFYCILNFLKYVSIPGRPQNNYSISVITSGYKDIAASDYNTTLKAKRKIALRALKAHGDGLDKLEKILLNEAEAIFKRFDAKSEEAFDPRHDLSK